MADKFIPSQTTDLMENRLNNLPLQLTNFVGRELEIVEITRLLKTTRLLTISGSGGSGKTRLALQLGAVLLPEFTSGVWLVELAPITEPQLIPQAVAKALKVKEEACRPLIEALARYLYSKKILLIVDNCEHLIEACALFIEDLLKVCPQLYILATSREALEINGETTWRIPTLSVPPPKIALVLTQLTHFEAVRLFIDRASNLNPSFKLTEQNAPYLIKICQCLDGIPLALELAAARTRTMGLEQIAARLDDRFQLLTGGSRNSLPRQKTLRGAIDWSYDLLTYQERKLFERLSIFSGGWTIEAAEAVCKDVVNPGFHVLEGLSQLVNKSLVTTETLLQQTSQDNSSTLPGEARFFLLETIRQYAREKLVESFEENLYRDRHLAYFLNLAEKAEQELQGKDQVIWLERLEREQDNFRAALERIFEGSNPECLEVGLRLAASLMNFWDFRSYLAEGRDWLEKGLNLTRDWANNSFRAKAHFAAGVLAWPQQDLQSATTHLTSALAYYRITGDKHRAGLCLYYLGLVATSQGNGVLAKSYYEQSVALFREVNDTTNLATALGSLGINALQEGDYQTAHTFLEESANHYLGQENLNRLAYILNYLGELARCEKNYLQAASYYKKSIKLFEGMGDRGSTCMPYHNLGFVYKNLGDNNRAIEYFSRGFEIWLEVRKTRFVPTFVAGFGGIAVDLKQFELAATLFGAFTAFQNSLSNVIARADQLEYEKDLARLKAILEKDKLERTWQAGMKLSLEEAFDLIKNALPVSNNLSHNSPEPTPNASKKPDNLSVREVEVLKLLAQGLSNKQIAANLSISVRTVETHLNSIYPKLNITSRSAATRYTLQNNLL